MNTRCMDNEKDYNCMNMNHESSCPMENSCPPIYECPQERICERVIVHNVPQV